MWNFILLAAYAPNQDLFQYSTGDLYSIQPLVNVLGDVAVKVISIVGFGIVIFSILKNALSGLYVINPPFWDKVDDIKNQAIGGMTNTVNEMVGRTNGNYAAQKVGGILTFFLSLIPNVKALTDFDDGVPVEKKQYFTKSLLLLIVQIFIGMMIFFGYPAKIANWIGNGGTYFIDAIIRNYDPVQVIQGVSDSFTIYNLATDGSPDPFDKTINKGSSEMIRVVQTKYSDMKKEPTQETAYVLENHLMTALNSETVRNVLGATEGYDVAVAVSAINSVPTYSGAFSTISDNGGRTDTVIAQSTSGIIQIKTWIAGSSLPTGSTKVGANDYFVWTFTATPVAISKTSSSNLIVFGGFKSGSATASTDGHINVALEGITIGSGDGDLRGTPGKAMIVDAVGANGETLETFTANFMTASMQQTSGARAILSFAAADKDRLSTALSSCNYLRVQLVGSWTYDVITMNGGKQNTVSVNVSEIRVKSGVARKSFALSIWDDVDLTVGESTVTDASTALNQASMSNK